MKVRAKANGNILDLSDEEGERHLAMGNPPGSVFERIDEQGEVITKESSADPTTPRGGRHKRRDMRAEE